MAISAKFIADFSSFNKAVKSADAELDQFDVSTKKVNKSLQTLVTSFSGDKIKAEAALAEEAVLRIGGASKLTADEQAKVNKVVEDAIAKYKALGQEAPKSLQMMADETKKVAQATDPAAKAISDFGAHFKGVLAGMVSAQAIIGGVKAAFGALTDFVFSSIDSYAAAEAAQKKLAVALRGINQATPQVISDMDRLATQFQRTTVYSDDLVTEMQALLVQVGGVMPQQMEGALQAATDLASGLGVDLRQATMLVGKAFEGETGTLKRYGIVIDEAKLKAEGLPAVLEAIQQKFGGQAQAEAEGYAGKIKQLANAWDNLKESVGKAIVQDPLVIATLRELKEAADTAGSGAQDLTIEWGIFMAALPQWARDLGAFKQDLTDLARTANEVAEQVKIISKIPPPVAERPAQFGTKPATPEELAVLGKTTAADLEAMKKATAAAEQYAAAIRTLRDQLSGAALAGDVAKLQSAFDRLTPAQLANAETFDRVGKAAKALYDQGATLTPELFKILLASQRITPQAHALGNELKDVGDSFKMLYNAAVPFPGVLEGISGAIGNVFAVKMPPLVEDAIKRSERLKDSWKDLSKALSELATIAGGSFATIVQGFGTLVAAANTAKQSLSSIKDGLAAFKGGSLLEGIGGVTSGVLGLVSAATAAYKALDKVFGNAGRDAVEEFASTFEGGFAGLHTELLKLGDAVGEELWKKLTQGVGRNSPEQAAKVIAEVEAALATLKDQTEETTGATEEQAQATIESATEAAKALEELGPKLDINEGEWKDWSEKVTAYLDDLAKTIRSMPVPSPGGGGGDEPGFAGGTHGQFVDFGAGTSVRLHGRERISTPGEEAPHVTRIYIDGRKVAEASARYIPEVMEGRF
jgi:hypothetical protein